MTRLGMGFFFFFFISRLGWWNMRIRLIKNNIAQYHESGIGLILRSCSEILFCFFFLGKKKEVSGCGWPLTSL